MKLTEKKIKNALSQVLDPELNISIVDLGLIYKVDIKKNKVKIIMTLTTIGCPLFPMIEDEIKSKMKQIGIKKEDLIIELTFDPPWSMENLTEKGKAMLGI